MRTWMITGASSGLGRALAEHVLAAGDRVVAAVRTPEAVEDLLASYPETATSVRIDMADPASIGAAAAEAERRVGGVDVLINNAGYGFYTAVEEAEPDAVQRLFATNLHGPVALIQALLPAMRRRGTGLIITVTSAGARTPMPSGGLYAASKAALEAVSTALRREVEGFGLQVMVVEPGTFRTAFRGPSADRAQHPIEAYDEVLGRRGAEGLPPQVGDPARAAEAIVTAVGLEDPPRLLLLGSDALAGYRQTAAAEADDVARMEHLTLSTDAED